MGDLYETLGVERGANPTELKRAWRGKALRQHPDKGGDPEEWHRIQEAYRTLSNSKTRAAYDETGEIPEARPSVHQQAGDLLLALFARAMDEGPGIYDLREWMGAQLSAMARASERKRGEAAKAAARYSSFRNRLKGKGEEIFTSMADKAAANADAEQKEQSEKVAFYEEARAMLEDLEDSAASSEPGLNSELGESAFSTLFGSSWPDFTPGEFPRPSE